MHRLKTPSHCTRISTDSHVHAALQTRQSDWQNSTYWNPVVPISFDSFEYPDRLLPYAVGSWFISIRQYLAASGFGLKFTKPLYTVSTRRTQDEVLMDDVRRIVKAPTKIRQINTVRLILRVMPLTNIHCRRIPSNSKNPCGPQNHLRSRKPLSCGPDRTTPARRHGQRGTSLLNSTLNST
jgi:hypothetical protein